MPPPATVGPPRLAIDGLAALGELGEEIDDEWQYVQDLVDAWRTRLEAVEDARARRRSRPPAASPSRASSTRRA